jgi:hypothetical protein
MMLFNAVSLCLYADNREEDKIILEQVIDHGPNTDSFRRITELVENVTTDQVSCTTVGCITTPFSCIKKWRV